MLRHKVWIQSLGRWAVLHDRHAMRYGHPVRRSSRWPAATLPIDRTGSLTYPIDGNDEYGDCGEAMAAHVDNTWTGLNGAESAFDANALVSQYLKQAGGDNGMSESDVIAVWSAGLGGVPEATALDHLDIDPLDAQAVTSAIENFGAVCLGMMLFPSWADKFQPGMVWAPVPGQHADPSYGHYVPLVDVDKYGRYKVITWGSSCWLDPLGLAQTQPDAFVNFSRRQFKADGTDWKGRTFADRAALWNAVGGHVVTPGPTPGPTPPPPGPTPGPTPPPPAVGWNLGLGIDGVNVRVPVAGPLPAIPKGPLHQVVLAVGGRTFYGLLKG